MNIDSVTVYASSSRALHDEYYEAADQLGKVLAGAGKKIVYGGGGIGLMGALAMSVSLVRKPRVPKSPAVTPTGDTEILTSANSVISIAMLNFLVIRC